MKKLMKMSVSAFIVVMLLCGNGWSYDATDHVRLAPSGNGDFLIYPFYVVMDGGWKTRITVINTSSTFSTVAKVVFRSKVYSEELLDFYIYLTPNDVWEATIMKEGANVIVHSEDDSVKMDGTTFATPARPLHVALFPIDCAADTSQMGYVTIIEDWAANLAIPLAAGSACATTAYPQWQTGDAPPVAKNYLECVFNSAGIPRQSGIAALGDARDDTQNILTGYTEFFNASLNLTSAVEATVMKDLNIRAKLGLGAASTMVASAANNMSEIEAALAVTQLQMPYIHSSTAFTAHLFNFPTTLQKGAHSSSTSCVFPASWTTQSPYWNYNAVLMSGAKYTYVAFAPTVYDMAENWKSQPGSIFSGGDQPTPKSLESEMELWISGADFDAYSQGFVKYSFSHSTPNVDPALGSPITNPAAPAVAPAVLSNFGDAMTFTGAPIIGTVFFFRDGGMSLMNPSKNFGSVTYLGASQSNYHAQE